MYVRIKRRLEYPDYSVLVYFREIMKMRNNLLLALLASISLSILVSCSGGERVKQAQNIIINDIMASNRTGLLNHKGKPLDWIELKNTSSDSINLEGFGLAVIKMKVDSITNDTIEETTKWEFPDVTIKGGENLIVFANKKKNKADKALKAEKEDNEEKDDGDDPEEAKPKKAKSLRADFNLPKEGGIVQFLAPNGKVITELKYVKLAADQAYARKADGSYEETYLQSPGFENTQEGYEKAMEKIDMQRTDPLLVWELMSRSEDSSANWVELKNTGTTPIDMGQYSISKKMGKNEEYMALPSRVIQPGEIVTIKLSGIPGEAASLQAPFQLGKAETIVLSKDGKFVDGINARTAPEGGSVGRSKDKKGIFGYQTPTPNAENGT